MRRVPLLLVLLVSTILAAGCLGPGTSPSPSPSPTAPASVTPSAPATASPTAAPTESASPTAPPTATPAPTASPSAPTGETMVVRAYFFLTDVDGGDPGLVPVLRTVPRAPAAAAAAMRELLAGPTATEAGASPAITTTIPSGTELHGVRIEDGLATVNLSREFETGGGSFAALGRLAQVVYTLTQFGSVDRVNFELEGAPVTVFTGEGIILDEPVDRSDFYSELLPAIFVDRPAWGAALPNPSRITGLANVFEATFQLAVLDRNGTVLLERIVTASCGTGCWGRFDVPASYQIGKAQWGTLRAWVNSPRDGQPENVREYPLWLLPA